MTLESLARTITKARYGTDEHWAAMLPAARAAIDEFKQLAAETNNPDIAMLLARIAQPNGAQ